MTIILELEGLLKDRQEWENDGIFLSEESIHNAIKFVENSIIRNGFSFPNIEVHNDGKVAFTWRKKDVGIANFAFDKNLVTWAAYFVEPKRTFKGRFFVEDSIFLELYN
tara:strand:- start:196 stop:522 length:327 start_codon:yes stop_codon:yes gene_type:complete